MNTMMIISLLLLISCSTLEEQDINRYRELAETKYKGGEWNETIQAINRLQKHTYVPDQHIIIKARSLRQLNQFKRGLKVLNQEIALRPHSHDLAIELAKWNLDMNNPEEAKRIMLKIGQMSEYTEDARKVLAYAHMMLSEWLLAQVLLEPTLKGDDKEAWFWLGQVYYKLKDYKMAASIFHETFKQTIYQTRSAQYLAFIYVELKDIPKANQYIRYLVLQDSKNLFNQKMNLKNNLNNQDVDKLIALKTFNDQYYDEWVQYRYFQELKNSGQKTAALGYLSGLLSANPGSTWMLSNYVNELYLGGEKELAQQYLQRSMKYFKNTDLDFFKQQLASMEKNELPSKRVIASDNRTYKVQGGDTLTSISMKLYNTTKYWEEIFKLNSKELSHPGALNPGMELKIPEERK